MMGLGLSLAERGLIPTPVARLGIRRLLQERINELGSADDTDVIAQLSRGPLAVATDTANEQHYELPPDFFTAVLGPRLKYSGCYWPDGTESLADAEVASLAQVAERAELADGQEILELGCGWGSLTLYMAERFPNARITAVSNSAPQRQFIEAQAPGNVTVITADMNEFEPDQRFDRVVSIEMFEHMRNYQRLLSSVARWLKADGKLFVHIFCHRKHPYLFETEGPANWMGRHFFTGGLMPSRGVFDHFDDDLVVEEDWEINGEHYARTAAAWREAHETRRAELMPLFERVYGAEAEKWFHRWHLFFLACEELFGYNKGQEWMVGHYRLARRP